MRGGGAERLAPILIIAAPGAAIDDQAFLSGAKLEAERAGMNAPPGFRRRAEIGDNQRTAGLNAAEADMRRVVLGPALGAALGEDEIDQPRFLFDRIVKQGQRAVAMAVGAKHRRHPVDRVVERLGRRLPGRYQRAADIDQMAQYCEMGRRAAFEMPAVG